MRHKQDKKGIIERVRASVVLLAFGLGTLAFLVAIDRPEWFHLRPVSGAAAAISYAGSVKDPTPDKTSAEATEKRSLADRT